MGAGKSRLGRKKKDALKMDQPAVKDEDIEAAATPGCYFLHYVHE